MVEAYKALRKEIGRMGAAHWRHRWHEWRASRNGSPAPAVDENGLAIPGAYLITLVAGHADWRYFLKSGEEAALSFAAAVDRNGGDFRRAARMLDLGCGCGRVIRHMPALTDAALTGVDYNRRLVRWCARHLEGEFIHNKLKPPLRFPDDHFDIVYLLSVFTHLRIETQNEWLVEIARIVRPGGLALITFHDEDHSGLSKIGVLADELVEKGVHIHNDHSEGSNLISTFQSRDYAARQFGEKFDGAEIIKSGDTPISQAIAVLRRPG